MKAGDILFDPQFRFHDGKTGEKLFVALAENRAGHWIVARTTSQGPRRSRTQGCNLGDVEPSFFIPAADGVFPKDTWICLDYLVELDPDVLSASVKAGKIYQKGTVPVEMLARLIDCAARAEDTSMAQMRALRDALAAIPPAKN